MLLYVLNALRNIVLSIKYKAYLLEKQQEPFVIDGDT